MRPRRAMARHDGALAQFDYRGAFGIDIGGIESDVPDLDRAYVDAAAFLEARLRP